MSSCPFCCSWFLNRGLPIFAQATLDCSLLVHASHVAGVTTTQQAFICRDMYHWSLSLHFPDNEVEFFFPCLFWSFVFLKCFLYHLLVFVLSYLFLTVVSEFIYFAYKSIVTCCKCLHIHGFLFLMVSLDV
jgi:hypothetical protein